MWPRLIRFRDAPHYLGMDRNRFNREVRPYLTEIPIGKQGIAFDRLDLDAWIEQYKQRNGRPVSLNKKGEKLWDEKKSLACKKLVTYGTSTNVSTVAEFAKARERAVLKKRKNI